MPHRRDRIRDRYGAPCHISVQSLHHLPVELDRAARSVLRPFERRDDLAGMRDFLRRWREDRVAGFDLARMNQRLTVEAEIARLRAFLPKAVDIGKIAVGSVENFQTVSAGGENAVRNQRQHRSTAGPHPYARLP